MTSSPSGSATPPAPSGVELVSALVGFGRELRREGMTVGTDQLVSYAQAAARLAPTDTQDMYWAGRACLVARREDVAIYDRVFGRWFAGAGQAMAIHASGEVSRPKAELATGPTVSRVVPADHDSTSVGLMASSAEALRSKRFADCTPEELARLQVLMSHLRLDLPRRRVRRTRPAPKGRYLDLRRTIRRSLRSHGELLDQARRARRARPRRLVLILDVSGSMAGYSRALLQFCHSAASATSGQSAASATSGQSAASATVGQSAASATVGQSAASGRAGRSAASGRAGATEVFCFGTRLTRVTQQLQQRRPDQALARAADAVVDWEGGTRIGDSLASFLRVWASRGLARGAVVVICSDGLERGDPEVLATQMARLGRLAYRVVWVNPLKADPRYEPLAAGMSAALPFVDLFLSGHDLSSLESLAALLPKLAWATDRGRQAAYTGK